MEDWFIFSGLGVEDWFIFSGLGVEDWFIFSGLGVEDWFIWYRGWICKESKGNQSYTPHPCKIVLLAYSIQSLNVKIGRNVWTFWQCLKWKVDDVTSVWFLSATRIIVCAQSKSDNWVFHFNIINPGDSMKIQFPSPHRFPCLSWLSRHINSCTWKKNAFIKSKFHFLCIMESLEKVKLPLSH